MKLKENYTREEADLMSLISTILKSIPHTYQGDSAYWYGVEVDFKNKNITINTSEESDDIIYYTLLGVSTSKSFNFESLF